MRVGFTFLAMALICLACAVQPVSMNEARARVPAQRGEEGIVPAEGYEWPEIGRAYWPTMSWQSAPPEQHGLDPEKLAIANDIAEEDPFFRSLLVVRNGFLVFENYYHGGAQDQKTEVWSVTKSFTSALVGIAIDEGHIFDTGKLMVDRYTSWQELHEPFEGTWRQDNKGLEIGAFGLRLTGREMAKFGFLYLNRGVWDRKTVVSEGWVKASTRDHVLRSETIGFGYHWMIVKRSGHIAFDADGWGGQSISVIPALDMVIVTKGNAVNPQGRSSYQVLEKTLEAVVK